MDPKQNKLSTGANVSRTMDNLNAEEGTSYGGMSFSKHNFDKIEPGTGDIILNADSGSSRRPKSAVPPAMPAATPAFTTNRSSTAYVPSEFQNPAPTKKSFTVNKKLIIGLLVVVALVAGGIGGYFLITQNMGKKSNSGSSSQESNLTLQQSFNRFANWMFYGTDSTDSFTNNSSESGSGLGKAISSTDNSAATSFLSTAVTMVSDLSTKFSKSNFSGYNLLSNYIAEMKGNTEILEELYSTGPISVSALLNEFAETGSATVGDYSSLSGSSDTGAQLASLLADRDEKAIAAFNILQSNGCVSGGEINAECRAKLVSSNYDAVQNLSQANSASSSIIEISNTLSGQLMSDIITVNSEFVNPTPNNTEGE